MSAMQSVSMDIQGFAFDRRPTADTPPANFEMPVDFAVAVDGGVDSPSLAHHAPRSMTNGPPPGAAESSKSSGTGPAPSYNPYSTTVEAIQAPQATYTPTTLNSNQWANGATSAATSTTAQPGVAYSYGAWPAMNWTGYPSTATTSYGAGSTAPTTHYNPHVNYQTYYAQAAQSRGYYQPQYASTTQIPVAIPKQEESEARIPAKRKKRSPSVPEPEPAPTLKSYRHWDGALKDFLEEAGLHETLKGFERDILVLSADWEEDVIPKALQNLVKRLSVRPLAFISVYM